MSASQAELQPRAPSLDLFEQTSERVAFGIAFGVSALITAGIILLATFAPGARPAGPGATWIMALLALNTLLAAGLAAIVGRRVLKLFGPKSPDAGVRLHRRFVGLFALAAVVPAVIVALVFGMLVTRGVETWFSSRVRTVIEGTAEVARAYVEEQGGYLGQRIGPMARDLNRPELVSLFQTDRLRFSGILHQAVERDFRAVYLVDSQGQVLAAAEAGDAPAFRAPAQDVLARAHGKVGEAQPAIDETGMIRALYQLQGYPDAYLYVVQPLGDGIMGQLRRAEQAVVDYREADQVQAKIQLIFALSYVSAALLVLVGAVWVGMSAATALAEPIGRLVQAADRVASGDLGARVEIKNDPEEIAVLSHAFNRMTSDLQEQQKALRRAGDEAESRRRFIETVLSGVSAGVIGLDGRGRISALNERAMQLLALPADHSLGMALADAAPDLAPIAEQALASGHDQEAEIDLARAPEGLRLRVRASLRADGGLVLTFDDITRLVAAQRNAAWRDVARRIAHEIKNPLTPIQLSAERLRRKYRGDITKDLETFDRCTDTIIRQVGDIGRMVDEFSAFARLPAPKLTLEDAGELLRQAVFAQRVAYPDTLVEMEEPGEPVAISADGRMLGQALANVLKNAGEAVSARRAKEPGLQGRIVARLLALGDRVAYEIEDNGVGLPVKDRARLTEPYVTTREKGTGLGLAIVKRILEEHGGELQLADAAELPGAKMVLVLPRAGATAATGDPVHAAAE